MYLIHVRIATPHNFVPPEQLSHLFLAQASSEDAIGHVSVHTTQPGTVTVGLFVATHSLLSAERAALEVATRAVSTEPTLDGCRVTSCSGALVGMFFDREAGFSGADGGRTMQLPDQASDE
ncbi:hypothetical protein [Streptomyces sp. S.PNR 29]|uniref:hypothetical protein n=1 Tax=Streptomyces sp. S.PNR 29 TaxID=2973805 RepID=UPI0025B18A5E|nr:hypothetical protein [Streptomyces sp. S.PNR 29]MDN0194368.1 hypothetical protein [Streptomyces sp. S.PNR 29]